MTVLSEMGACERSGANLVEEAGEICQRDGTSAP